ncbi:YbjN domain-containing protein [Arsenicicoccus dermatophilus]|uniref:YbjN domain-containing protein n=1 Tax=Arsenicicoccus dermatophilus TaxID=1076331 RepID=UPI001F4C9B26|nr:YbjN domain-containing protein [Arsenicicoccus dermatophilus]MCH8611987.1 YbjN domain-containing protein [Arsenicicoccus dermatophilus]
MTDAPCTPAAVLAVVERFCEEQALEHEAGAREGELVVTLPGERKLRTVLSLLVGSRGMTGSAFVIRNPDEAHEAFYRTLLRRNLRLRGLAYSIDASGDVYVTSQVPLGAVDETYLDQLFGAVLEAADRPFDELLEIGFATSIRKEWAWRLKHGEPTHNLAAFAHLRPADAPDPGGQGEDAQGERSQPTR